MIVRNICALILAFAFSSAVCSQDSTVVQANDVDVMANEFRAKQNVPGLGICIGQDGKVVYARGFGMSDLENGVKATEETVFRLASISKPITAVAIMQLVEAGKIALDDPIQKHCPEFENESFQPTIRDLLCHQGGVRHYKFPGESAGKESYFSIKDSLKLFVQDELLFEPGTDYRYTTYGYTLLGRAIETASGQSYRDYLQTRIFDPADMKTIGLDDWFRLIPNRTRGYAKLSRLMHRSLPKDLQPHLKAGDVYNCQLHDTSMKVPGGGLIGSPTDLVKFGQAMLNDKLIKRETRERAWEAQTTAQGMETNYGLGWGVSENDGLKLIRHSGGQAGTSTMLVIVPEHAVVVAVMCNLQNAPAVELAIKIATAAANSQSR